MTADSVPYVVNNSDTLMDQLELMHIELAQCHMHCAEDRIHGCIGPQRTDRGGADRDSGREPRDSTTPPRDPT